MEKKLKTKIKKKQKTNGKIECVSILVQFFSIHRLNECFGRIVRITLESLSVCRSICSHVRICVRSMLFALRDVTTVNGVDVCVSLINLTFRDVCGVVEKRNTTEVAEKERQMKKKKTVMCQMY